MNTAKEKYETQTIGTIEVDSTQLQPIRFQGQFIDEETGLHYNRFRYYDNDMGMFISRDPIGLLGGDNVFAYAPNPTGWIDPSGLTKGGKQNISTEGLNANSDPEEVKRRINDAEINQQHERAKKLRGLLKVIKRNIKFKGSCCLFIPTDILDMANDPCLISEYSIACQEEKWGEMQ